MEATVETIRIGSVDELVKHIKATRAYKFNNEIWFRGQRDSSWNLLPSAYRGGKYMKETECTRYLNFKRYAHGILQNTPHDESTISWLLLMQHHGLPTRILDWTSSPFVAMFFAINDWIEGTSEPAIWMLDVSKLNPTCTGGRITHGVCSITEPINDTDEINLFLDFIRKDPNPSEARVEKLYMAFSPNHTSKRVMLQQGHFVLHGVTNPMNSYPEIAKLLTKFVVNSCTIKELKSYLSIMGIKRRHLFDDLDNIALDIRTAPEFEIT